ncbi:MAG: hypothetical protein AN484_27895 [Aphanizomenon flos-aquae WA102]|uniref:Uncharacterized protein n=1 Tax=Aphanizomenon flos-aquae WA102 TaxID=1710896 RepID=A0A1B7W5Z6_APHFL|nr:MAG: hypothetical protein AN484_27895 [Aphanizomenon flos-aquae WA102]
MPLNGSWSTWALYNCPVLYIIKTIIKSIKSKGVEKPTGKTFPLEVFQIRHKLIIVAYGLHYVTLSQLESVIQFR